MRNDHQPVAELNCTAEVRESLNTAEVGEKLDTAEDHRILGYGAAPGGLVDIPSVDIMEFDSAGNVHHFDIVVVAALGKGPATDFQGCMMFEERYTFHRHWTGSAEGTHCYPHNSPGLPCWKRTSRESVF